MRAMKWMILAAMTAAVGCGDDDGTTPADAGGGMDAGAADTSTADDTGTADDAGPESNSLSVVFTGLPQLGDDYVYEGWVIVDGAPVSTGRFSVSSDDGSHTQANDIEADAPAAYVLTIEPAEGDDPAPSDTHVIAGDFSDNAAALGTGHMAALGDDFSGAAGSFILATPTDEAAPDENGIWYLDPSGDAPVSTLTLPTLPAGWAYEGWVVGEDGPISTGTFTDLAAADSDGAGPEAGSGDAPPFPGQDFVDPARDLSMNHMAVISIEPSPDDSPAPFQFKPLGGPIGTDTAPTLQSLNNIFADNTIGGTATLTVN